MQFLMLITIANTADYEAGKPVGPELDAAMGEVMGEWTKKGAFVSAAGLKPTSQAYRIRSSGGKLHVIDGPFAETKEVIGGYAQFELPSKEEAVAGAVQFMELHRKHWPGWEGETEIRQIFGPEDFDPTLKEQMCGRQAS